MRLGRPFAVFSALALCATACRAPSASAAGPRSRVQSHFRTKVAKAKPATIEKQADGSPAHVTGAPADNPAVPGADEPKIYLNLINGDSEAIEAELGDLPGVVSGRVTLFTEPRLGLYPKLWKGRWVNGGTPVEANLAKHLAEVRRDVEEMIPDPEWDGFAVIDYEHWGLRWPKGKSAYRARVLRVIRAERPTASRADVESIAKARWEKSSKAFMLSTIDLCRRLRPKAKWGFFGYPKIGFGRMTPEVERSLDQQQVLIDHSDALYPEVYARRKTNQSKRGSRILAPSEHFGQYIDRLIETSRRLGGGKPVMAYASVRYNSAFDQLKGKPLSKEDLTTMLTRPIKAGADGVILWGAVGAAKREAVFRTQFLERVAPALGVPTGADSTSVIETPAAAPPPPPGSSHRRRRRGG